MADSKPPTDHFNVQITTIKLNGASNYLLWSQALEVYVTAHRKMSYLTMTPPASTDDNYEDWKAENATLLNWLWNSMEPSIASNMMFHKTAMGVWEELRESYSQDTYLSWIYDLYEKFFSLKQEGKSLGKYYNSLKGMWEELNVYQPISTDAAMIKAQRSEFLVAKFLSGLDSDLQSVKSQLLTSEKIPSMNEAYCHIQRVVSPSTVKSDAAPISKDNSALFISTGGRSHGGGTSSQGGRGSGVGRGRGAGFGGRGAGSNPAGSSSSDGCSRWCSHCGRPNHTFANDGAADFVHPSNANHGSPTNGGSTSSDLVSQLLQRVQQLEASSSTPTATLAHSGTTACFASSSSQWVIDSGASSHMTSKPNLFSSFTQSTTSSRISIADGSFIPVTGYGDIPLFSNLSLSKVLHDLATRTTIGGGHEKGSLYYFDLATSPTAAVAISSSVSPLHWHYWLGHPSLSKLRHLVPSCKSVSCIECEACEALLTACFLINRMPSSVLHDQIPFNVVFPERAAFSLPPRKGYRCFDPVSHQQFVSANVTFFENTPYFPGSPSDIDLVTELKLKTNLQQDN
ncbi:uncharacterized protein LOC122647788 [Telopea speciosissima]|uniref:uncharacterized protein LOC122647788 n=1 Tax=Telopea speciosissima TaxID=54955 RepID=UPI001CC595B8|nr:uncharacterized protein LOC122647788 [Telopea speciosissima]